MISHIDVRIPYGSNRCLGEAYNRAMETVEDWVLFMDHDVFLLNPNWHSMLLDAIKEKGHKAGMVICVTNRIGCLAQRVRLRRDPDDLKYHLRVAKRLWKKHGSGLVEFKRQGRRGKLQMPSGFFMLTQKEAWEKTGGFTSGFIGVDNNYALDLWDAGYAIYLMPGLYVYHRYDRRWKWK